MLRRHSRVGGSQRDAKERLRSGQRHTSAMLPPWGGRTRELPVRKLSARKLLLSAVDSNHDFCRVGSGITSVGPHSRSHQSASTAEQLKPVDSDCDSCRWGSGSTSAGPHRRDLQSASTAEQPGATVPRLHGADTLDLSDGWQHHVGLISSLKDMHHTGPHTPAMLCSLTHEKL